LLSRRGWRSVLRIVRELGIAVNQGKNRGQPVRRVISTAPKVTAMAMRAGRKLFNLADG
jgi:hypothetical protein